MEVISIFFSSKEVFLFLFLSKLYPRHGDQTHDSEMKSHGLPWTEPAWRPSHPKSLKAAVLT